MRFARSGAESRGFTPLFDWPAIPQPYNSLFCALWIRSGFPVDPAGPDIFRRRASRRRASWRFQRHALTGMRAWRTG